MAKQAAKKRRAHKKAVWAVFRPSGELVIAASTRSKAMLLAVQAELSINLTMRHDLEEEGYWVTKVRVIPEKA